MLKAKAKPKAKAAGTDFEFGANVAGPEDKNYCEFKAGPCYDKRCASICYQKETLEQANDYLDTQEASGEVDVTVLCEAVKAGIKAITTQAHKFAAEAVKRESANRNTKGDVENMATKKNGGGFNLPSPEANGGADFNDFLRASHIGKMGSKAKLVFTGNVREGSSQFGAGLIAEVKLGKTLYDFQIKFASGNYRALFERFGKNPAKWKGPVNVQVDKYLNNLFVKVVK